jgi:hypothetical protein
MLLRKIYLGMLCLGIIILLVACGGDDDEGGAAKGGGEGGGSGAATEVDPATAGSISGKVMFDGTPPEPEPIDMAAEPTCQEQYPDGAFTEKVVVNNGMLANVFVYVKGGLEGKTFATPTESVLLDQKGCHYTPHVLGVQTNQTIVIRNSDTFLHNIHPRPENSRPFNVGQPKEGMETGKSFSAAEIMIPVGCDVHDWMSAYVGVVDHPYFAVTGEDGTFELPNLPPGDYVVEAWHEEYGVQEMKVTVGEKQAATADFTFRGS